jgi:hypothetical protein
MSMTIPWGKFKGSRLEDVDSGYLHFIAEKADHAGPPLKRAALAELERRKAEAAMPGADFVVEESKPTKKAPEAAAALCDECGLPGSPARPLFHKSCSEIPF